jgi:hypothetical protein
VKLPENEVLPSSTQEQSNEASNIYEITKSLKNLWDMVKKEEILPKDPHEKFQKFSI